jgi:membrane associated rhomboid family serine protease
MLFNRGSSLASAFSNNNMLTRLIYANLAVFIAVHLLYLPFWLMKAGSPDAWVLNWLAVPAYLPSLLVKPWTLISYMFLHLGFWHLLSNMLWLYFLGQLFVEFLGERKLWTVYISGGLAGAFLYIFFFNVFPVFRDVMPISKALGASASVMAVVVAIGTYIPNYSIRLLFLGDVKLKYIAIFSFVLDVVSISNSNSGGHIAHIGGAALGFLFAKQWQSGKDITAWVGTIGDYLKAIFSNSRPTRMKVKYKRSSSTSTDYTSRKKEEQDRVDAILDKISRSGYDSLSKAEKEFLFRTSNRP